MESIESVRELSIFIRTERKRQGLNQTSLSYHANVSRQFISSLESGKETCEVGKILQVCKALGIFLYAQNPLERTK